ncbi:MAG: substrate-binding domain-containing protein [Synechococcaceae cyanobacterium]
MSGSSSAAGGPSLGRRRLLSVGLAASALLLAAAPLPGLRRPLLVSVGSELEPSLRRLEPEFERQERRIDLRWQVEGSQDMVNNTLEPSPRRARVLIPANDQLLRDLARQARAQGQPDPFLAPPTVVASTLLVAVAWPERAKALFRDGRVDWSRLRQAVRAGRWPSLGGPESWGTFKLRLSDPLRSNSAQLVLDLWSRPPSDDDALHSLRRAVYRPARSTDILLREFISGGPNDGDLAFVYEAGALRRAAEARQRWPGGYQLLVSDPSIAVQLAAAVLRGQAEGGEAEGERFVRFLAGPQAQSLLRQEGFRDASGRGGSAAGDRVRQLPPPPPERREELLRRWHQAGD